MKRKFKIGDRVRALISLDDVKKGSILIVREIVAGCPYPYKACWGKRRMLYRAKELELVKQIKRKAKK